MPTPAMDRRENRAPTMRNAVGSRTRESAAVKAGMPPIQTAAPSWCSALTASSGSRSSNRAAAWVVAVAAARMSKASATSGAAGASRPRSRSSAASSAAAAMRTRPASDESAPSVAIAGRCSVPARIAVCIARMTASVTASPAAPQIAARTVARSMGRPARPRRGASGRARSSRKITPPSATDWATIVTPCSTTLR